MEFLIEGQDGIIPIDQRAKKKETLQRLPKKWWSIGGSKIGKH